MLNTMDHVNSSSSEVPTTEYREGDLGVLGEDNVSTMLREVWRELTASQRMVVLQTAGTLAELNMIAKS